MTTLIPDENVGAGSSGGTPEDLYQYTLVQSIGFSSAEEVNILNLTAHNYRLRFIDVRPIGASEDLFMIASDDNGGSFETSSIYSYRVAALLMSGASNVNLNTSSRALGHIQFNHLTYPVTNVGGSAGMSGEVVLENMNQGSRPASLQFELVYLTDNPASDVVIASGGGMTRPGNATGLLKIDALKFFFTGFGSEMSGRIEVWEINSPS